MTPRAPSLPPEQRRAAILSVAGPLLASEGPGFTTRQVADAAGIAEGTLFRVFPTKADLIHAIIDDVLDPDPVCRQLAALRPTSLDDAVHAILEILSAAIQQSSAVFTALHAAGEGMPAGHHKKPPTAERASIHERRTRQLTASIVEVLEPFDAQLRNTPPVCASYLRSVAIATNHPFLSDQALTDPAQVSSLVLHGLAQEES